MSEQCRERGLRDETALLDEATLAAAEHLKETYHLTTTTVAIRYAVQELATRVGWKAPPKRRRTDAAR